MSESFYKCVRAFGAPIFRLFSRPLILHAERAARPGAYLLAPNHESPFDAALLIATTPRVIYWLSIVEIFRRPIHRWFLSAMCASPLDRSKPDVVCVRGMARHLQAGRIVGLFPEGEMRCGAESVLSGGGIQDGVARLAQLVDAPVLPCVVVGGRQFEHWRSWLPLRRTRWAVAYGEPICLRRDVTRAEARAALVDDLRRALLALHEEVRGHLLDPPLASADFAEPSLDWGALPDVHPVRAGAPATHEENASEQPPDGAHEPARQ